MGTWKQLQSVFLYTSNLMGPIRYQPDGSSKGAVDRLFTQFHVLYPEHLQETIVQDLVRSNSKIRLLLVTVAFEIGVDINNIRRIIHIGVPDTIEEYFQEVGRCRRGGLSIFCFVLQFI